MMFGAKGSLEIRAEMESAKTIDIAAIIVQATQT